jgi:hypothetical protein
MERVLIISPPELVAYLNLWWLALKRVAPEHGKLFALLAVPALVGEPGLHGRVEALRDGQVVAVVPQPKRRDLTPHDLLVSVTKQVI